MIKNNEEITVDALSIGRTAARKLVLLILLPFAGPAGIQAQDVTLTLGEAIELARRTNPDYLTRQGEIVNADWAVRESYGALLPGASASTSFSWQDAGTPRFGIFNASDFGFASSTSYLTSSYSLGVNYRLSGSTLLAPGREKAARRATELSIEAAGTTLEADVKHAYLAVLRARDGVTLAQQELTRADENLKLAQARVAVGQAIPVEGTQAEVERGRAEVALLQAQNLVQTERLRLMQLLGVSLEAEVQLTTEFAVSDVPWTIDDLVQLALEQHPALRSSRANVDAANTSVRMARSAYLPSLSMQAGFSGFTRQAGNEAYLLDQARSQIQGQQANCQLFNNISSGLSQGLPGYPSDCSRFVLTPQAEAEILSGNDVFPFDFSREPLSVSLTLSLPVFEGFTRERQIEQAKVAARVADHRLRADEIRVRTQVGIAYLDVSTARRSVDLEARNRDLADEQLRLARELYRVGANTFLELQEAETVKARADRAYLEAIYTFHDGLATLEAEVGRPLRAESR
ncbi:MAG: TolC family protein [Longimicrobiales bacterium]